MNYEIRIVYGVLCVETWGLKNVKAPEGFIVIQH